MQCIILWMLLMVFAIPLRLADEYCGKPVCYVVNELDSRNRHVFKIDCNDVQKYLPAKIIRYRCARDISIWDLKNGIGPLYEMTSEDEGSDLTSTLSAQPTSLLLETKMLNESKSSHTEERLTVQSVEDNIDSSSKDAVSVAGNQPPVSTTAGVLNEQETKMLNESKATHTEERPTGQSINDNIDSSSKDAVSVAGNQPPVSTTAGVLNEQDLKNGIGPLREMTLVDKGSDLTPTSSAPPTSPLSEKKMLNESKATHTEERPTVQSVKDNIDSLSKDAISTAGNQIPVSTTAGVFNEQDQLDCNGLTNWTFWNSSLYKLIPTEMTWDEAKSECDSYCKTSHLVFIETDEENEFISRALVTEWSDYIWIGLRKEEDIWKWYNTTNNVPVQPTIRGNYMNCAHLTIIRGPPFLWREDDCNHLHYFICETETI